jgi:hypothetical protein
VVSDELFALTEYFLDEGINGVLTDRQYLATHARSREYESGVFVALLGGNLDNTAE